MWSVFLLNVAHPTTHMQRRKALFKFYIAFPPQYSPIRIRTEVSGFKVPSDNHYTIGEYGFAGNRTQNLFRVRET